MIISNKRRKWYCAFLIFLITFTVILFLSFPSISSFLSKTQKVSANILVVEGWLSDSAFETVKNEFIRNRYEFIVVTGNNFPNNYFNVFSNGFLIFYTGHKLKNLSNGDNHILEVLAYSELEGENSAHFNFFVNDSLVADFYAGKKKEKYRISWNGDLSEIDSVLIQFDNDNWGEWGDRNLYIKEIVIDNKIHFPYQLNSEYEISDTDNKRRILNNFGSNAELARNKLLAMGIDSSQIIAVPGKKTKVNRTLKSALAFRTWLDSSIIEVKGINILSQGTHARRTWMIFNKVLNKQYEIGIISIPTYNGSKRSFQLVKVLREILGIVYYWLILIPY